MPTLSNSYFLGFPKLRKQPRHHLLLRREDVKTEKAGLFHQVGALSLSHHSFLPHGIKRAKISQVHVCFGHYYLKIPLSRKHAQSVSSHLSHISYLWTWWEDGGYEIMTGFLTFSPVSPVEIFIKYI